MSNAILSISIGIVLALIVGGYFVFRDRALRKDIEVREGRMERRMFELAILKELGERIGYSLNIQNIIDIITGSLHQLIDYSTVSYLLIEPEKILFKMHLEKSVSRHFIDEVEERMLKSLSALVGKEYTKSQTEEVISGAIVIDEIQEPVRSYFNIPLVIGDTVVGVLTVAHTAAGLYKEEEMTVLYKIVAAASRTVTQLRSVVEIEERKLAAIVESMTEGVVTVDTDYRVLAANPAARSAIGLDPVKELTLFDFIDHLDGKFDIRGRLEEVMKLDRIIDIPEILIRDKFFRIVVSPVKSSAAISKGDILGAAIIFRDITHDKELEKLREDFTAMMVHELRSPLVGIRAVADRMEKDQVGPEKDYKEHLALIDDSATHMLGLVNDMLDVSKLESGKFEIHPVNADIRTLITERIGFYKSLAESSGVGLTASLAPVMPTTVSFDQARIAQVLNNLISNALKFTPRGGVVTVSGFIHRVRGDASVEAKEAGMSMLIPVEFSTLVKDSLVITVTDTGSGIPHERIGELFNKFKQLASSVTGSDKQGTGLGLAIVKGIVEAHTGTVGVVSEYGTGSTFYFTLPLV